MPKIRTHQHIHDLAQRFAVRAGCDGVVILTNDYKSAITNYPDTAVVFLLQTSKTKISDEEQKNLPKNVGVLTLRQTSSDVLKNKVFVCVDFLEVSGRFSGYSGRRAVSKIAERSALSIISVPENKNWNARRFKNSLNLNKTALFGRHKDKELLAIGGQLTNVYGQHYPLLPVLAIVSQFNEVDIIEPVISHLLSQGADVHIIDNWSNDGSYEAVAAMAKTYPRRVSIERCPERDTQKYEWTRILKRVTEVAKEKSQYKWIISNDADEIRWSPWPGATLQQALSFIDHVGFNITDYTVFNFSPTKDGYQRGMDPVEFFKYGDFGHEGWHFMQLKTWRNNPDADIASSSGHLINVPDPKIFPFKFLLAHYPLRSNVQAAKKIFQDRKPRFLPEERKQGWHSHYDKIHAEQSFVKDSKGLIDISKSSDFLERYLIERVSGIGIKINKVGNKRY